MKQRNAPHCDASIWPIFVRQTSIYAYIYWVAAATWWEKLKRRTTGDSDSLVESQNTLTRRDG